LATGKGSSYQLDQAARFDCDLAFLRTEQTAAPTIERFPDVPVEIWPIEEFTYLKPSRWNGTLSSGQMPRIERYWNEADIAFCDGNGAESFATLLLRARGAIARLQAQPDNALTYVFSHGQFIQAVRSVIEDIEFSDWEKIRKFRTKGQSPMIANAELVSFNLCVSEPPSEPGSFTFSSAFDSNT
jgi:probable phosphoglycerate mutase